MATDLEPMLQVSDLSVTVDKNVVLTNLTFTVRRGEVCTILGPNGAGKTMLLRTLVGALPHEGSIRWKEGVRLGYVPQRLPYIRSIPLSVSEFFALKRNPRADVAGLLRSVGLGPDAGGRQVGDFSSGQFQRILIAWALASDPDVLLFDEPTAGIDVGGEETVYGLLSRLHQDRDLTMLIVTHDLAMVHRFSSMVLCLNRQLVCMGPPLTTLTAENLQRLFGCEVTLYKHHHG